MSADNSTLVVPQFPEIPGVEFRHIPGYTGYAATNLGQIWSCREGDWHLLRPGSAPRTGHLHVSVRRDDGKRVTGKVHQLVLFAFVGPRPDGCEARHFPDPNPSNNRPENLVWGTPKENSLDKLSHGHVGYRPFGKGTDNPCAKLNWEIVNAIRSKYATGGITQRDLASEYDINQAYVSQIIHRKVWNDRSDNEMIVTRFAKDLGFEVRCSECGHKALLGHGYTAEGLACITMRCSECEKSLGLVLNKAS